MIEGTGLETVVVSELDGRGEVPMFQMVPVKETSCGLELRPMICAGETGGVGKPCVCEPEVEDVFGFASLGKYFDVVEGNKNVEVEVDGRKALEMVKVVGPGVVSVDEEEAVLQGTSPRHRVFVPDNIVSG